jgi:hypothetical protein
MVTRETIVQNGDNLGEFNWGGAQGTTSRDGAEFKFLVDGTPGASAMPGRYEFWTNPGSTLPTRKLSLDKDGIIRHRDDATIIVDAESHLGLRSYTAGTLPSASTAARLIYVSDGASNKRIAVSDGTDWRFPDGNVVS